MSEIGTGLGILIVINNYLHDVATGLLVASSIALWVVMDRFDGGGRDVSEYFLRVYAALARLIRFSLYWILIGGVPRLYFYKSIEWANAVGNSQVEAIIIKHVLVFSLVGTGIHYWRKFRAKVNEVRASLGLSEEDASDRSSRLECTDPAGPVSD